MKRPAAHFAIVIALAVAVATSAQPTAAALTAFNACTASLESRQAVDHRSPSTFLVPVDAQRLRHGEVIVDQLSPADPVAGALLHHWRATAFVPAAHAADLEHLLRDVAAYPEVFAPQVLEARIVPAKAAQPDHFQASMRVRQHHVLTVVMDSTYDVSFYRLDAMHLASASRSTSLSEIAAPGTPAEHRLAPADAHGFLWRQNTYWSAAEWDGGLVLQIESVSLSRAIPHGLAWAVEPFIQSVPRDSLEFTLRQIAKALTHPPLTASR